MCSNIAGNKRRRSQAISSSLRAAEVIQQSRPLFTVPVEFRRHQTRKRAEQVQSDRTIYLSICDQCPAKGWDHSVGTSSRQAAKYGYGLQFFKAQAEDCFGHRRGRVQQRVRVRRSPSAEAPGRRAIGRSNHRARAVTQIDCGDRA